MTEQEELLPPVPGAVDCDYPFHHICGYPVVVIEREEMIHGKILIQEKRHRDQWEDHSYLGIQTYYFDGRYAAWFTEPVLITRCPNCHFELKPELLLSTTVEKWLESRTIQLFQILQKLGQKTSTEPEPEVITRLFEQYEDSSYGISEILRILYRAAKDTVFQHECVYLRQQQAAQQLEKE